MSAELPGLDEKNIEVNLANGILTIKGQKEEDKVREEGGLSSQRATLRLVRALGSGSRHRRRG